MNKQIIATKQTIAFQGEKGAYSHIACLETAPQSDVLPCETFVDAFGAVIAKKADIAMIPVENSYFGRVADIHHLLPDSGLRIIGEYFLRIRHQLLACKGVSMHDLRVVRSHPQALGQCRNALRALGLRAIASTDTAGAAKELAAQQERGECVIASPLAARIYNLAVLQKNIEDTGNNMTRFFIMGRDKTFPCLDQRPFVTSFVFRVRNLPAALYKVLGGFATNGINMTKLESYHIGGDFVQTQFYADIAGHPHALAVKRALEELEYFSEHLEILGVYPAMRKPA